MSGVGVNAAMAAYQSALLSAMAAHSSPFPNTLAGEFLGWASYSTYVFTYLTSDNYIMIYIQCMKHSRLFYICMYHRISV